jgi:hypothetical protein
MTQRSTADAHPVRAIAAASFAVALAVIVPNAVFSMGWYETGLVLFVLVVFLWRALLALAFLAWAKRRRDLN